MARPGAKDCNCETSLSPLYSTVTARSDSSDTARAMITMRGKIHVDTTDGLRNLMPSETYELSYTLIARILETDLHILYFEERMSQELFLLVYPEFKGKI